MKIAFITSSFGDAFGLERVLYQSVELLRGINIEVEVITSRLHQNGLSGVTTLAGLSSLSFLDRKSTKQFRTEVLSLLKSFNPDIVHFGDLFDYRILEAVAKSYPSVLTAHTVSPTCPASTRFIEARGGVCEEPSGLACVRLNRHQQCLGFLKSDLHRYHAVFDHQLRKRVVIRSFKKVFAISQFVKEMLWLDGFPDEKIEVVPNPVFQVQAIPLSEVPENLLVCAARLVPLKGIDRLLHALKLIESHPWTLWLCGEGPLEQHLRELTRQFGLENRIHFRGKVPYNEMQRIYASCLAVVQPNAGPEGFGLSAAEAMAQGTPVVAFSIPALSEVISSGKTGLLASPADIPGLSRAILKLISEPELAKKLGSQAQRWVRENYAPDIHLRRTLDAYSSCLSSDVTMPLESWVGRDKSAS